MGRVRGWLPFAGGLLVAVAAVGLLGFSSTLNPIDAILGRGAMVEVPDVVGAPLPRATGELEALELVVEDVPAYSLSVPRGAVIRQDPPSGERIRQGETVELVVSRGANRVEMPDAVGHPFDEATAPLADADIDMEVVRVADEEVPEGIVLSQHPNPGVMVTGDDAPRFEVSSGPAKRPVPEIVGLSASAAAFELGASGFVLGEFSFVDHPELPPGAVAATDPPVGTELDRDAPVDVVFSAGAPAVAVPDVVNVSRGTARDRLTSLGFLVSTAGRLVGSDGAGDGQVFEQYPAAGTPLRPGESVTIVVGRLPPSPPPTTTTTTTSAPPPTTPTTAAPGGGD